MQTNEAFNDASSFPTIDEETHNNQPFAMDSINDDSSREDANMPESTEQEEEAQTTGKKRGLKTGSKILTNKTQEDWFKCCQRYRNLKKSMTRAAFLKSRLSGDVFVGTKSEEQSFGRMLKKFDEGSLIPSSKKRMRGDRSAQLQTLMKQRTADTIKNKLSENVRPFSTEKIWKVYLSGEIHSDWREVIADGVKEKNLPVALSSPNTSHEDSDDCGAVILGMEEQRHNWDKIGANMNNIRTKTLIKDADIVVVRFGEKYRQWNAAFDAGYAAALGKSIITLHPPAISHMLKEVNASAQVVCAEPTQVVDTLAYCINGTLPEPLDGEDFVPIADRLGAGNPNP